MQAYHIETTMTYSGTLTLTNLPFRQGESVEIIILPQALSAVHANECPLRGKLLAYIDPTALVAQDDWEVLQ